MNDATGFWASKRVLVTGHTGFKGAWLCHWLLRHGAIVTGLALQPPSEPSLFELTALADRLTHYQGDVRDLAIVRRCVDEADPQVVFHMAAQSLVLDGYRDPVGTFATNVMGTVHVLEALRTAENLEACIVVTSDKCYEHGPGRRSFSEGDAIGGADPYSASKGCTEIVASAMRRSFFENGPGRLASVRAGNVIGGGDWARDRLVPDIVRALTTATVLELRHPEAVRPWQHVLEPLSGYLALAERLSQDENLVGGWNFGPDTDDGWTVGEIAAELVGAWGADARGRVRIGSSPFHEAAFLHLDSSKARVALDWQPLWDVREALARTIGWYHGLYVDGATAFELVEADLDAYSDTETASAVDGRG